MLGAVVGDVIGSIYEHRPIKTKDFPLFDRHCRFTDDTVLTMAVAECVLRRSEFGPTILKWARRYPDCGYGGSFRRWMQSDDCKPYGSFGNGSAMRVSPVAYLAESDQEALDLAARSAACTHDHPQGIAGAQAVIFVMRSLMSGRSPRTVRWATSQRFGYDLSRSVDQIRPSYCFDVTCQGTVPQAIICALEATDFEDAIRNAISLGGDSDTIAAIAGSIAEVRFGVPAAIAKAVTKCLPREILVAIDNFEDARAELLLTATQGFVRQTD